jgi:predicted DNA-binding transcriptional regulator YafY
MMDGLYELGLEPKTVALEADHHLTKRFKLTGIPSELLLLEPTEKAALERHLQTLSDGTEARAITKVLADTKPLSVALTNNVSELIEKTAHTGNVSPRTAINETQMRILEDAIGGFEEVKFKYRAQKAKSAVLRQVRPLGLLFGRFAYLVASAGNRAPISYRLDLLENVELAGEYFVPKKGWNFKEWASESFGVFHGDALWNVKIRFSKDVANRAEKVQFHPSQKISHGRNGSLVIEMRCRGHRELIWELLHPDWIGHVKIESPESLQKEYLGQLERAKLAVFSE